MRRVVLILAVLIFSMVAMASSAENSVHQHEGTVTKVAFELREVGDSNQFLMFMRGKINGNSTDFIFDTGSTYNVISPEMARQYGLERLEKTVKVKGMKAMEGQLMLAKQLYIGGLRLQNLEFLVLNSTPDRESDKASAAQQSIILGQSTLRLFSKYTIDFAHRQIVFSRKSALNKANSNLVMTETGVMQVQVSKDGHRFPVTLDTGATTSTMGPDYYKTFTAEISRLGKWDIDGGSGYGGVVYNSVFVMPSITLQLADKSVRLPNISVISLSSHANVIHSGYGRLGLDFFRQCKRVEIDNTNMTFHIL